tara:strand:+ start:223 stop:954 length:732 start_codon:yes stop_codon:yes gene_type:complete
MAKTTTEAVRNNDLVKLGEDYFDKYENARAYPMKAIGAFLGVDVGSPQSKGAQEWMKNLIIDKITQSGMLTGDVNYQDYDPRNPKSFPSKSMPFTQYGPGSPQTMYQNTLGRGEFSVPPTGGEVSWSPRSTQYDFPVGGFNDIINQGGVLGMLSNKIVGGPPKLQHYVPDVKVSAKDIRKAYSTGMMQGTKVARDISNITNKQKNRDTGVKNKDKPASTVKVAKAVSSRKPSEKAGRLDNPYA